MENLRELFEPAIKEKGITIKQLCKDCGITEQGFHQSLRTNRMRVTTYNIVKEYLGLTNDNEIKISSRDNNYWKTKYEESQKTIKTLLSTIEIMSLGKHNPVFQSQTAAA